MVWSLERDGDEVGRVKKKQFSDRKHLALGGLFERLKTL